MEKECICETDGQNVEIDVETYQVFCCKCEGEIKMLDENFCDDCKGHISINEYRKNKGKCNECKDKKK